MILQKLLHLFFFISFHLFTHLPKLPYNTNSIFEIWCTEGCIKTHLGSKFGWNVISSQGVIRDYSQILTPIGCHAYIVNRLWEEAINQDVDRLTIEPQTICGLNEIKLSTMKILRNNHLL